MKKNAFTLSEVLITLVIIGVIAAITVPALMNNTNAQEFRSAFKKAISALNQAIALEYALEGLTAQDYTSSDDIVQNLFKRRMNNIQMPADSEFTVDICDSSADSMFTTADGIIFCVTNYQSDYSDEEGSKCDFYNKTPCTIDEGANVWIDVNGLKKPNRITTSAKRPRDIYQAQIYSQKVVAYGEPTQAISSNSEPQTGGTAGNTNQNQPPNKEDIDFDAETPDEDNPYYDQYDPSKRDNWQDFLRWLWDWLMGLIT